MQVPRGQPCQGRGPRKPRQTEGSQRLLHQMRRHYPGDGLPAHQGQHHFYASESILTALQALRAENVDYVVAPYEADAQLCYLEREGYVDGIITEDSDLLVFGCRNVSNFPLAAFSQGHAEGSGHLQAGRQRRLRMDSQRATRHGRVVPDARLDRSSVQADGRESGWVPVFAL